MNDFKSKWDEEALEELRRRVLDHKSLTGETWKVIAGKIGLGESTLVAFSGGKYKGDIAATAEEISRWFQTSEIVDLFAQDWVPGFQLTRTAASIHSVLTWAHRGNMVTIIGDPGVGKTFAAEEYCRRRHNAWMMTASPSRSVSNPFMEALFEAIQLSPGARRSYSMSERLRKYLKNRDKPLIVIDESQHLGERILEELRSIHDDTKVGIAFMGNREVTRAIDGSRTANFAQRSSRISMREVYSVPSIHDVRMMLEAWGIIDDNQARFLEAIALRPGGGALRQMTKVLELATLLANAEHRKPGLADIKAASDQLNARLAA